MLDIIDYRNLRYQGETRQNKPHGLGIIIDYNHLFCLALWKEGKICGPAFIVFSDSKIFCGRIKQREVDGLCCFYLQEKIQTFANYSEHIEQKRNFISVLPFCNLILEVDHKQQKCPKVSSHQRYKSNDGSLQKQLTRLFKKSFEMQQYKTWKDFLLLNFIEPFQSKLHWKELIQKRYTEYFIGVKYSGLGIKLLLFNQEEDIVRMDGETVIPIEMGMFSHDHLLNGLGKKVSDLQYFKYESEGDFGQDESNLLTYERRYRHKNAIHFYLQQLKLSVFFENTFLNIQYLSDLSTTYSKFNVQLVEETQKIAQVILQNPDQSTFILAEIEEKRQRRRITPQKSLKSLISSEYQTVGRLQPNQKNVGKNEKSLSKSKKSEIIPLTEIQKQIYSSVQKKSISNLKRQNLEKTPKSIQKLNEFDDKKPFYSKPLKNYEKSSNYKKQDSNKFIHQIPSEPVYKQRSSLFNQRTDYKYRAKDVQNYNFNKRQQPIFQLPSSKNQSPFHNINVETPKSIINNPNNSQYKDRQTISLSKNIIPEYMKERLSRNQTDYKMDTKKKKIFNQQFVYNPIGKQDQRNKRHFQLDDSSEVEGGFDHPVIKQKYNQQHQQLEYDRKTKENEQLINFFNKAMEDPYSSLQKEENIHNILHWTLGNSPTQKKAPGKIRTIKKKQDFRDQYPL